MFGPSTGSQMDTWEYITMGKRAVQLQYKYLVESMHPNEIADHLRTELIIDQETHEKITTAHRTKYERNRIILDEVLANKKIQTFSAFLEALEENHIHLVVGIKDKISLLMKERRGWMRRNQDVDHNEAEVTQPKYTTTLPSGLPHAAQKIPASDQTKVKNIDEGLVRHVPEDNQSKHCHSPCNNQNSASTTCEPTPLTTVDDDVDLKLSENEPQPRQPVEHSLSSSLMTLNISNGHLALPPPLQSSSSSPSTSSSTTKVVYRHSSETGHSCTTLQPTHRRRVTALGADRGQGHLSRPKSTNAYPTRRLHSGPGTYCSGTTKRVNISRPTMHHIFGVKFVSGRDRPRFYGDSFYYITAIVRPSPAHDEEMRNGIQEGNTIYKVNGRVVKDMDEKEVQSLMNKDLDLELDVIQLQESMQAVYV